MKYSPIWHRFWGGFGPLSRFISTGIMLLLPVMVHAQSYSRPTSSSPIAISRDDRLIWVVNPSDDSVSVFRSDNNTRLAKIPVGDEPQSLALTPDEQYVYVANAAGSSVTLIRIKNASWDTFSAGVDPTFGVNGQLITGAEPWNAVVSPDGRRVFVANSGQDTITVIDATTRSLIGHVSLRADPYASHVQPRGLAVTIDNSKLFVTRFLSSTRPGGRQGDDFGKVGA